MFTYESLEVWKLAISYAKSTYLLTENFPISENYGLTSQLRRAAVSISANIAEGSGSTTIKDKIHFLDIAIKSTLETTSELQLAYELSFISKETRDESYEEAEKIVRKIRAFKNFLKNDNR